MNTYWVTRTELSSGNETNQIVVLSTVVSFISRERICNRTGRKWGRFI